ncbi:MAG: MBL fold metallo-hydrolase [Gammaproteobacteria bacterium]|nr:MBL fold metallo-hydrolase [Gammaproteobacteria bacterium]
MATLKFLGAAQQVTGSCYLIETGQNRILLECGILQGRDRHDHEIEIPFSFDPQSINAVIISHAHLDHSGLIPLLTKQGYRGPIYTTTVTQSLLPIMYDDAASLMQSDIDRKNRRLLRAGKKTIEPPYSTKDVEQALSQVIGLVYEKRENLLPGIELRFQDAGHILGSAIVELWLEDNNTKRKLVFTGDLGNSCAPLMKDPTIINEADVLLLESTYGDRNHRPLDETLDEFKTVIKTAAEIRGNILIPSFALGRTQDLIYWLGQLYHDGELNHQKVFIDSPMAIKISHVYERFHSLLNEDDPSFRHFMKEGWENWLPDLTYTQSVEDSMALNRVSGGAIVIAGSGMCTGGRILHHFKYNLWNHKTQVVVVGYQAIGTLGRVLVDGADMVKIFGDEIAVKAKIHTLGGFSAHAGQDQLINWAMNFQSPRPRLFLVHGEPDSMQVLQQRFVREHQWDAHIPSMGEVINI